MEILALVAVLGIPVSFVLGRKTNLLSKLLAHTQPKQYPQEVGKKKK